MDTTPHTSTPTHPRWRVHATNLDAALRDRQGELLLTDGHAVHQADTGATTGSVALADLVSINASISDTDGDDRQVVELASNEAHLRLAAPVELVLAALRSVEIGSLVRMLATTPAVAR